MRPLKSSHWSSIKHLDTTNYKRLVTKIWTQAKQEKKSHFFNQADYISHPKIRVSISEDNHQVIKEGQGPIHAYGFLVETLLNPLLKSHNIPVSENCGITVTDKTHTIYTLSYIKVKETPLFVKSSSIKPETLITLGKHVKHIHTIKATKVGPLSLPHLQNGVIKGIHTSWKQFLSLNRDKYIELLKKHSIITTDQKIQINTFLKNPPSSKNICLLHGDIAHHNIIVKNNRITAFIDWENAIAGDPLFDVSYYATGCFNNNEWFTQFCLGYFSSPAVPRKHKQIFSYYYLVISIAKAVSRLNNKTVTNKHLPSISERIRFAILQLRNSL